MIDVRAVVTNAYRMQHMPALPELRALVRDEFLTFPHSRQPTHLGPRRPVCYDSGKAAKACHDLEYRPTSLAERRPVCTSTFPVALLGNFWRALRLSPVRAVEPCAGGQDLSTDRVLRYGRFRLAKPCRLCPYWLPAGRAELGVTHRSTTVRAVSSIGYGELLLIGSGNDLLVGREICGGDADGCPQSRSTGNNHFGLTPAGHSSDDRR